MNNNRISHINSLKEAFEDVMLTVAAFGIVVGVCLIANAAHRSDCPCEKRHGQSCSYFWCKHYNGGVNHGK